MIATLTRTAQRLAGVSFAVFLIAALTVIAPSTTTAGEEPPGSLVLAGCGSNTPILRLLTAAFRQQHPDVTLNIQAIGSTSGIWLTAAGAVPVGVVSRPLRGPELGLGLTVVPYARTALVLVAHPTVPDDDLSGRDLLAIYRGAQLQWPSGQDIAVFTREEGDISIQLLSGAFAEFSQAYAEGMLAAQPTVVYSEQQMHRLVTRTPFALGFSDLGTLTIERMPLKALRVDGVAPTVENVASGRYPLAKTLAFVFRSERLPEAARQFLAFVQSPAGHRILLANGYLPAMAETSAPRP